MPDSQFIKIHPIINPSEDFVLRDISSLHYPLLFLVVSLMGPIRRESRGRSSGTKSPSSTFVYEKDGSNSIDLMEVEKENGHEIGSISKDTPSSSSARKAGRKSLSAASASSVNIAANTSPSSSTNPNVTSISLSSSSPVKKSQQRRVHKYASKYVDSMMEGIMDDIVKNAKHPVAVRLLLIFPFTACDMISLSLSLRPRSGFPSYEQVSSSECLMPPNDYISHLNMMYMN